MATGTTLTAISTSDVAGLALALAQRGIGVGDTVAQIPPNAPEQLLEAHYGVPMAGAVRSVINICLDAEGCSISPAARRGEGRDHRQGTVRHGRQRARHARSTGHR